MPSTALPCDNVDSKKSVTFFWNSFSRTLSIEDQLQILNYSSCATLELYVDESFSPIFVNSFSIQSVVSALVKSLSHLLTINFLKLLINSAQCI